MPISRLVYGLMCPMVRSRSCTCFTSWIVYIWWPVIIPVLLAVLLRAVCCATNPAAGLNYFQSVTPTLSAGGEFFWLGGQLRSGLGVAVRHTGDAHIATVQVATTGILSAQYAHKVTDKVGAWEHEQLPVCDRVRARVCVWALRVCMCVACACMLECVPVCLHHFVRACALIQARDHSCHCCHTTFGCVIAVNIAAVVHAWWQSFACCCCASAAQVTLATDLLWHWASREATATVGYDVSLRQARLQGKIDSAGEQQHSLKSLALSPCLCVSL